MLGAGGAWRPGLLRNGWRQEQQGAVRRLQLLLLLRAAWAAGRLVLLVEECPLQQEVWLPLQHCWLLLPAQVDGL